METIQPFEFTSRYDGICPLPDPATVCIGQCEGMGCYPQKLDAEATEHERAEWLRIHAQDCNLLGAIRNLLRHREFWFWKMLLGDLLRGQICDGRHFVTCADCGGTGKRGQ